MGICIALELKTVLAAMGEKVSDREVRDMIRQADANGDGVIDYSGIKTNIEKNKVELMYEPHSLTST